MQGVNSDGEPLRDFYVEHDPVDLDASHDGMCREEFADECNINILMARYDTAEVQNRFNRFTPEYLDLTQAPQDLMEAMETMRTADAAFMRLPASVRREFDNDPFKFVDYAANPENVGRMREWGLAAPEKVPDAPMKVEVVNGSPPASTQPAGS